MASEATHRAEALANRELAEYLLATRPNDSTALRWAVTAAFYTGLYALSAYLAARGVSVANRNNRASSLADPRNGVPVDVFEAY